MGLMSYKPVEVLGVNAKNGSSWTEIRIGVDLLAITNEATMSEFEFGEVVRLIEGLSTELQRLEGQGGCRLPGNNRTV